MVTTPPMNNQALLYKHSEKQLDDCMCGHHELMSKAMQYRRKQAVIAGQGTEYMRWERHNVHQSTVKLCMHQYFINSAAFLSRLPDVSL